jgi:uncharacterized protein YbjT (DUF2867 family)
MTVSKIIFVTGATGNQGGAVARSLIRNGFRVKALTRHPTSPRAQHLKSINAEIIEGDLNEPKSFRNHLENVDGLFSVQTFVNGIEKEIKQGCHLIDLAKEHKIPHFLYSSVSGADLPHGIPHWESKYKIENYLKASGIAFTIIRPASFFENFLIPQVYSRLMKGKLVHPVNGDVVQQFISADDIGKISVKIFNDLQKYKDATITIAAEQMDLRTAASCFSDVLGKQIVYQKLPMIITRLVMGKTLYKMFKWVNENEAIFIKDLNAFRKEYPDMISLRDWIKTNFTTL